MLYKWRNVPRLDGYSPAQLMFGRHQCTCLPIPFSNGPINFNLATSSKDSAHSRSKLDHERHKLTLSTLQTGQPVLLQNPKTSAWDCHGVVVSMRPDCLSYIVNVDKRFFTHPWRLLRPVVLDDPPQQQVGVPACPAVPHLRGLPYCCHRPPSAYCPTGHRISARAVQSRSTGIYSLSR